MLAFIALVVLFFSFPLWFNWLVDGFIAFLAAIFTEKRVDWIEKNVIDKIDPTCDGSNHHD
jgi:hypothetical protein